MDHPLYVGASSGTGVSPQPLFDQGVDLVFVIDSTKPWYPPEKGAPDGAEIIWLEPEPGQEKKAYWNYPADLLVTGDSERVLPMLVDRIDDSASSRPTDWRSVHDQWERQWRERAQAGADETPIDPFWLCRRLDDALPNDAIVCNETVTHGTVIRNLIRDRGSRTFLSALKSGGGALGTGLSVTLGAKLAAPDRLAVSILGDGGYSYNPVTAAFGAAAEHELPILALLFNNRSYRSMRASLEHSYPDGAAIKNENYIGSEISPTPAYRKQAEALGAFSETVSEPAELEPALENAIEAVESGQPALLDIQVDDDVPEAPDVYE